jgi:3',5'-cyclic AMP phosphodiesterase CpdA
VKIAHLTDLHLDESPDALAGALQSVRQAKDLEAEALLLGGDIVMDAFEKPREKAEREWQVVREFLAGVDLPVFGCLGNHDLWTQGDAWDREWAVRELGMPSRYYARDLGAWRLVVLDSTHPRGGPGYVAKLDEDQWEWLEQRLGETDRPTAVLSHIPILSAAVFLDGDNEVSGNWQVPGAWMHIDARRIKNLFVRNPNVRLCLSGHTHLAERVEYLGVTYVNSGAVCGGWWKGPYQETPCGFGLVDLNDDGTFEWRYVITCS